jgi:hypothetical protein
MFIERNPHLREVVEIAAQTKAGAGPVESLCLTVAADKAYDRKDFKELGPE